MTCLYGKSSYSKVEKGQKIEFFFSVKNEGYTWYYIGGDEWIADDGTWIEILSYNGDVYADGWSRSFDKSKIKRIQIIDEEMKIYPMSSQMHYSGETVHSGETYLVMDVKDCINETSEWSDDFAIGYIWLQIGDSKWIKVKNETQIAVIEGEPLDFSNALDLTSTDEVSDIMNRGYIEIMYGPMSFRKDSINTLTYEGKEYAYPGEIYYFEYLVPSENKELWWAKLSDGIYLFIGNNEELIVK